MTLLLALGCGSGGGKGDGGAAGSGAAGSGGTGGASAPSDSCQAARLCALNCTDAECVASCGSAANSAAQAAFAALVECTTTLGQCTTPNDVNCLCDAQCRMDPLCIAEVDACVGSEADSICGGLCFGG